MSKAVTTRLSEKELHKIEQIAKKENLDRSSFIRKLVLKSLKDYSLEESSKLYQEGVVSLAEAASLAEVNLWEMMEFLHLKNVRAPPERLEDIEKEILEAKSFLSNI